MLKAIERALLLQEFELLRFASADQLMQLAEVCREEMVRAGEVLLRSNEPAARLLLLVLGDAALEGSEDAPLRKTALNLWPCLAGVRQPATCRCVTDCTVLTLAAEELTDLLSDDPELSLAFLKYAAHLHLAGPA
jgi:CRP-like cAMP-binding protein